MSHTPQDEINTFNQELFSFLDNSPTPFHAVQNQVEILKSNGFVELNESENWSLNPEGKYFVIRNNSSIIAFVYGKQAVVQSGVRMIGAHTDSPCLKVKPNPEIIAQSYLKLGVEVYGGVLLNPWFDRDLSLAGRVIFQDQHELLKTAIINFNKPVASVPSLAIHLDREANKNRSINPQTDIPPVVMLIEEEQSSQSKNKNVLPELLQQQIELEHKDSNVSKVVDYELCFYDTQKAAYIGFKNEFIASSRLDNLLSCFVATKAICNAADEGTCLIICNDHEEVGSASTSGAQGTFLKSVLNRLAGSDESLHRMIDQSMLISADNAHGIHPNFSDKHDSNHGPIFNKGPVIKINANQRYASNAETTAIFKAFAEKAEVPIQSFVVRTDMGCGSTIGPITATEIGVKTLDVGVPTFAMHSIREICGNKDAWYLNKVMNTFFDFSNTIAID